MNDDTLLGVPLDRHPTDDCDVKGCDYGWTIATDKSKYDPSVDGPLVLCNGHSKLFREISEVRAVTLHKYRKTIATAIAADAREKALETIDEYTEW